MFRPINLLSSNRLVRLFSLNVDAAHKKNHYDSLGITPKAAQREIKSAFYELSKQFHPDVNKDSRSAEEQFREISAAYEVLRNYKSRKLYDREILMCEFLNGFQPEDFKTEAVKDAPFCFLKNKSSTPSTDESRNYYDMDEWMKAHYSKTFKKTKPKKQEKQNEMSNKNIFQIIGSLLLIMGLVGVFGNDPSTRNQRSDDTDGKPTNKPSI